jgi:hypothetical protein
MTLRSASWPQDETDVQFVKTLLRERIIDAETLQHRAQDTIVDDRLKNVLVARVRRVTADTTR